MKQFPGTFTAMVACLLAGCGGGGGGGLSPSPGPGPGPTPSPGPAPQLPDPAGAPSLAETLAARYGMVGYPIGAAIEPASTTGGDATLLQRHFSSLTAENAMKPDTLWPNGPPSLPNYGPAEQIVDFAVANGMGVRGHTLLWHRTAPSWLFEHSVLASRMNSWVRKSSRRPTAASEASSPRAASTWPNSRSSSSRTSAFTAIAAAS